MASTLRPLQPIPPPQEPVVELQTGRMTRNWYQYFKSLDDHMRDVERRATELENP